MFRSKYLYLISPHIAVASAAPEFTETLLMFFNGNPRTDIAFAVIDCITMQAFGRNKESVVINLKWFPDHILEVLHDIGALGQLLELIKANVPLKLLTELLEPYFSANRSDNEILQEFIEKVFLVLRLRDRRAFSST